MTQLQVISPVDGKIYARRQLADSSEIDRTFAKAKAAQRDWQHVPVQDRAAICSRFVNNMTAITDELATELTWQMGRPVTQSPGEIRGFEERARHMISIAEMALTTIDVGENAHLKRYIQREPLGVVLTIAAWNYPYLIAVNSVVPAIMAGNAVVIKHSAQTPLCGERIVEAFSSAGLPANICQYLHMTHEETERCVHHPDVNFVAFTGSVAGGRAIQRAAGKGFAGLGLELGGKDPAYVRADADLEHTIESLVDGSMFNSGQSCCAIERIYAHVDIYNSFIAGFADLTASYCLGNPFDHKTNLGPMVRNSAAEIVRNQIAEAVRAGATALIDPVQFPQARDNTPYVAPQVLVDVDQSMRLMTEETFGPVIGIAKVKSDEEAVRLMNDSEFGLTASIWTLDEEIAIKLGNEVDTGTWYMNRCDYLDPALSWTGIKNSGRGCTLSSVGYEHLTRPKSFYLRTSR